ncbi:MAG: glycosyltransferase family 1 protein [Actinomycetota bacterium]|nr:glycosyltransferase family 1 protein [Actinomycetota bacterium]
MLTVALDATPLLGSRTGIGVAVDGFVRHLADRPELELSVYGLTLRGWRDLAAQIGSGRVRVSSRPAPAAALLRMWARSDWPPGRWWTGPARLVHGTNFVVPPSGRAARVVSVWDMTAVRYPELCSPTSRRYPQLVARAVAGGAWIHTATRFVADEILEHFRVAPERVRVVPPAVDPGPHRARSRPAGPPYILGLGRTEPRKDFPGLVRAFDLLAVDHPDLELHLAGPPGWAEDAVAVAIASARHRDRIRRLGWVADRAALIAGAAVFAYPSVYEGFGLPPLEAMALGVPVVATRAGAVPEVVGPAAELVAPGRPEELAGALGAVLSEPGRRHALVEAGRARVARFDGASTAAGLIATYRDAAASP